MRMGWEGKAGKKEGGDGEWCLLKLIVCVIIRLLQIHGFPDQKK